MKHRTVEKSVERCELSIVEGTDGDESSDEEVDSLESKLIIKLLCKHGKQVSSPCLSPCLNQVPGVVKTHRLVLSVPTSLMAPGVPDTSNQARVNIGPIALRNMLEHFPLQKGSKADPQLIWFFDETDVALRTCESSMGKGTMFSFVVILFTYWSLGNGEISTELTFSAEEFDLYDLQAYPIGIAFHLREFNVR